MRKDKNGIEITSKNRTKVRVTFIDMVSSFSFDNITQIESYKRYNKVEKPLREDVYVKANATCVCVIY